MHLKFLLFVLIVCLLLPLASAEENISIQEIGTDPDELIDGTNAWFFANLTNSGDTPVVVEIIFMLDSALLERKTITLEPGTHRINSDNSSTVSLSNKNITALVYLNDREIASMSEQITVQQRRTAPGQRKNDLFYGYLLIGSAVVVFIGAYVFFITRRRVRQEKIGTDKAESLSQKAPTQAVSGTQYYKTQYHNNAVILSENFRWFLSELKKLPEGYRQEEEQKLLISVIEDITNMLQNLGVNNIDEVKKNLANVKTGTSRLFSMLEKVQRNPILPVEVDILKPVDIQTTEPVDKNEIETELENKKAEVSRKKQFVDVVIPEFLLKTAEVKMHDGDIKAAKDLILAVEMMLENDDVIQRLRKLREMGF